MQFKAVIFDLDGTLLNTLEDIVDSANRALLEFGYSQHGLNAYRYFVGSGARELIRRALPAEASDGVIFKVLERYRALYSMNQNNKTKPYTGIIELLDWLESRGFVYAVLSNKPQDSTNAVIEYHFSDRKFLKILGQREGVPIKPDPTGVFEIVNATSFSRPEFLFLGDTGIDMQAAKNAGVYGVGVLWGFRDAKELVTCGSKHLIEKPQDLINFLN